MTLPLREVVQEATAALVRMDAERLEELARCCHDLNHDSASAATAGDIASAEMELYLLGRVLYETRANLKVLSRLHAIRLRTDCGEDMTQPEAHEFANDLLDVKGASKYGNN